MAEEPQTEQLSEEIKTLIRGANFGDLATLIRDGAAKQIGIAIRGRVLSGRIRCSRIVRPRLKGPEPDGPDGLCRTLEGCRTTVP